MKIISAARPLFGTVIVWFSFDISTIKSGSSPKTASFSREPCSKIASPNCKVTSARLIKNSCSARQIASTVKPYFSRKCADRKVSPIRRERGASIASTTSTARDCKSSACHSLAARCSIKGSTSRRRKSSTSPSKIKMSPSSITVSGEIETSRSPSRSMATMLTLKSSRSVHPAIVLPIKNEFSGTPARKRFLSR